MIVIHVVQMQEVTSSNISFRQLNRESLEVDTYLDES